MNPSFRPACRVLLSNFDRCLIATGLSTLWFVYLDILEMNGKLLTDGPIFRRDVTMPCLKERCKISGFFLDADRNQTM